MNEKTFRVATAATVVMVAVGLAAASPTAQAVQSFGSLDAGFNVGNGIPDDTFVIETDANNDIQIGLSATQRFSAPVVTNNGVDTFFAQAGTAVAGPNNLNGTLWNLNFSVDLGNFSMSDFEVALFVDFDPTVGVTSGDSINGDGLTALSVGGIASLDPLTLNDLSLAQGSQNMLFGFWTVAPPNGFGLNGGVPFDGNAAGEYSFTLSVANNDLGVELATTMNVVVESANVPVGGVLPWLALGLLGLAWMRRGAWMRGRRR